MVDTLQLQAKDAEISRKREGRTLPKGLLKECVISVSPFQGLSTRTCENKYLLVSDPNCGNLLPANVHCLKAEIPPPNKALALM